MAPEEHTSEVLPPSSVCCLIADLLVVLRAVLLVAMSVDLLAVIRDVLLAVLLVVLLALRHAA